MDAPTVSNEALPKYAFFDKQKSRNPLGYGFCNFMAFCSTEGVYTMILLM